MCMLQAMSLGGLRCWEMTNVLFKTPVGLSEITLIELNSESNRLEQDPCNCDRFCIRSSPPCSLLLSVSRRVHVRRGFRATWQPFSCDYGGTICGTVQSVLMAHFQVHQSYSHSLRDLSTCYAPSLAPLSNSSWFTAFGNLTSRRRGVSWQLNCLSVSGASLSVASQVPCFCPCVCLQQDTLGL